MSLGYDKKAGKYRDNIFRKMEKTAGAMAAIQHPLRTAIDYADPDIAYGARFGKKGDEAIEKVGAPVVGALASATLGPEAGPLVWLLGKAGGASSRYMEKHRERYVGATLEDVRPGYDNRAYLACSPQGKENKRARRNRKSGRKRSQLSSLGILRGKLDVFPSDSLSSGVPRIFKGADSNAFADFFQNFAQSERSVVRNPVCSGNLD